MISPSFLSQKTEREELILEADDVVVEKPSKVPRTSIWDTTDDLSESGTNRLILSVVFASGTLGLCYYDTDLCRLHIMLDMAEKKDYELLQRVMLQVEPTIIISSSKQDDALKNVISRIYNSSPNDSLISTKPTLEVLPSSEFKYETSCRRILSHPSLPGVPVDISEKEKEVRISSLIPLDSINMMRSIGALLKYLEKRRVGIELEDITTRVPILSIKRFTLDKLVLMDETTFSSLRIFYREIHPSVYKGASGSKEGLSLFGIANHTRSSLGQKLLRLWFLRPLKDISELRKRQEAITFLSSCHHTEVTNTLSDCLRCIKNIPRVLARMAESQLSISDWQALYKTTYNAIYIGDLCRTLPQSIDIFKRISEVFSDVLYQIAGVINKVVDFEESSLQNRFVVKLGVDSDLDKKKHTYNGLPDLMTKVATNELGNLNPEVKECQVVYVPQLGYLLRFKKASWMKDELDFHLDNLEFVFLSGDHVHYKTAATIELDELLGDTQCEIHDSETTIMHKLQSIIIEHSVTLIDVVECASELDCLISLAILAKDYNYVKPELTEDNVIYIKKGRHPLQELCVNTFVPNDTCLSVEHSKMKILTGANASGKSVYLTQVGLIVYLAHIGSFVPAEGAKIGIIDGLFTRIQTKESVSVAQSAFLIDINQVSNAVLNSTSNSLILLDEFGKGTATVDGLALLVAVLRFWLDKNERSPCVLVSTHFHSVIQQQLLPESHMIEYLTMDTVNDKSELIFLYQLVQGHSDTSHACHIASTVGLSPDIIERAQMVSEKIRSNESIDRLDHDTRHAVCAAIVGSFLKLNLEKENDEAITFLQNHVALQAKDIL